MVKKKEDRPLYLRILVDIAGFGLMIIAPFLGWLPGPGGIPLFIAGLALVATNHEWAENLLKQFEEKREYYRDKYLMASPKVSISIDIVCILLLIVGSYIAFTADTVWWRVPGLGLISVTLIIILSNQKRFERISKWFKTKFKKT